MVTRAKEHSTLNDLTRRVLFGEHAKVYTAYERRGGESEAVCPPLQCGHKSNRLIDAKISFYGTYVQLNEQVTLQNQDPKMYGVYKSSLIDSKLLPGKAGDNEGQAGNTVQPERSKREDLEIGCSALNTTEM
jgi:hypothetical protein